MAFSSLRAFAVWLICLCDPRSRVPAGLTQWFRVDWCGAPRSLAVHRLPVCRWVDRRGEATVLQCQLLALR